MRKESFGWTLKLTELYRFSGQKIYPGRGIIFIRSDSQVFLFLNSKCKRYFHNKLKPSKLPWTAMYRNTRTQLAHRLMKKHLNRIIDESFPSNVDNGGDSQDKIGVRSKKQSLRTTYMNVLLGLIETLCQLPVDLSDDDLDEASIAVSYVAKAGLKVDWLETKLEEVEEKKEKIDTGKARLQQMKEELQKFNQKCLDLKALMEKDNADLSTANVPLSFDDVV